MSVTQEELVVRMGLDVREFERRLAESERIAKQYSQRIGAAMNTGGMGGSMPAGWSSVGNLSQASQAFLKGGSGGGGLMGEITNAVPILGRLPSLMNPITAGVGLVAGAFAGLRSQMKEAYELAEKAEVLQTSSSFVLALGKAAKSTGSDLESTSTKVQHFEVLIGKAKDGSKEALETLEKLGVSPWGKSVETTLLQTGEAFKNIVDPVEKARLAQEAFGKGGLDFVQTLDKLPGKMKGGVIALEQRDLDTLEAAERGFRKMWGTAKSGASDYAKIVSASVLRFFGVGRNASEADLPVIGQPGKSAEQTAKEEKEIADAKKDYFAAVRESGSTQTQLAYNLEHALDLERKIKGIAGETAEKYKLQKELLDTQKKIHEERKKLQDDAFQKQEKQLAFEQQMTQLKKEYNKSSRSLDEAKSDRSGWSVDGITQQGIQYNRNGYAVIPQQLFQAAQRLYGRNLSQGEINQMSVNYEKNYWSAKTVSELEEGAHAMRLLGPGAISTGIGSDARGAVANMRRMFPNDPSKWAGQLGLDLRRQIGSLTTGESNPLRSQEEHLSDISDNIQKLLFKADREGLNIRPVMGE